jgi:hypothetical protein
VSSEPPRKIAPAPAPAKSREFLSGRRVAVLATEEEDGSAYLSAIWFEFRDGTFLIPTGAASRKARNALARPRGSIVVDERGGRFFGVGARGALESLDGPAALAANDGIHRRYVTDAGMGDAAVGGVLSEVDDLTIRLIPRTWHEWDMGEGLGPGLSSPDLAYPLDP